MILPDTSHKYHANRAITLEDMQKSKGDIFFGLTVSGTGTTLFAGEGHSKFIVIYLFRSHFLHILLSTLQEYTR